MERSPFEKPRSRRAFLASGLAAAAGLPLSAMLGRTALASALGPTVLSPARAKRVVMVFLSGGLSQLDLFDEKPLLNERRGEEIPPSLRKGQDLADVTEKQGALPVVGSKFRFKKHGRSGLEFSELLPGLAGLADKVTLVRSLQSDNVLHEAAVSILFTGTQLLGRPSFGSWVSYALGRLDENLPEFVVMLSGGNGGAPLHPRLWHSGFLPGRHQGVPFRSGKDPVLFLSNPPGMGAEPRQAVLDAVKRLNAIHAPASGAADGLATRIEAMEMAARMQVSVPELADLAKEPAEVLEDYGARPGKESFANNCLLARRLLERGTRFVQLCDGGWDHHYDIPRALPRKCEEIDRPLAALIRDLEERGLLEDTVVLMTGEFGRTSYCEGPMSFDSYGRDHNRLVNCVLLAGGGFKRGFSYGRTDDWGWDVVENPVHVHDLHATLLHALGLEHEKLTFRHQGRDFRLTDVAGRVVHDLLS